VDKLKSVTTSHDLSTKVLCGSRFLNNVLRTKILIFTILEIVLEKIYKFLRMYTKFSTADYLKKTDNEQVCVTGCHTAWFSSRLPMFRSFCIYLQGRRISFTKKSCVFPWLILVLCQGKSIPPYSLFNHLFYWFSPSPWFCFTILHTLCCSS
jgi:hypothetical protein